jgi:hypothetical protein
MPNIKMKLKVAGVWQQLFPETIVDQISDATPVGKNLLKKANPGDTSFIQVGVDGSINYRTSAQMLSDLGAAAAGHTHDTGDITDLAAVLAAKADLDGGVILSSQVPSYVTGGLKFKESISTTTLTIDSTWLTSKGITSVSAATQRGVYFIVTNAAGCTITLGAGVSVDAPGDEGDSTTPITLEVGDWLVFKQYDTSTFRFTVVNNTYAKADTANFGIVRLSNNAGTTRAALDSNVNAEKVVDEKILRQVMKDIYYADTEAAASTALNGDLLFEY